MKKAIYAAIAALLLGLLWLDFWVALASIGAAILLSLPFLWWLEPRLVFYPNVPTRQLETTPEKLGFHFGNLALKASDGTALSAWWIPCAAQNALTILFFHGNAGNISHRIERIAAFQNLGAHLLLLDPRGYGQSEGKPGEKGTYLDARAAYDWVLSRGIEAETVVFYGESLGTALAVELATQVRCGGVVLEAPFTSVVDVARKMLPFLPVRFLVRNRYDSLSKIAQIGAPLLIFHARDDEMFALHHAKRLFEAAPQPKTLVELRGGHSDAFQISAAQHQKSLGEFFAQLRLGK